MAQFIVIYDSCVLYPAPLSPAKVIATVQETRRSLKNPPKNSREYLATLEKQSLPQTCAYLREYEGLI